MTTFMETPQSTNEPKPGTPAYLAWKAKQKKILVEQESNAAQNADVARKVGSQLVYSATGNTVNHRGQVYKTETEHVTSGYDDKLEKSLRKLNPEAEDLDDLTEDERAQYFAELHVGDVVEAKTTSSDNDIEGTNHREDEQGFVIDMDDDENEADVIRSAYRDDVVRNGEVLEASSHDRRQNRKAKMRTVEQGGHSYSEDDFGDFDDSDHMDNGSVKGILNPDGGLRTNPKKVQFDNSVRISYREPVNKK